MTLYLDRYLKLDLKMVCVPKLLIVEKMLERVRPH